MVRTGCSFPLLVLLAGVACSSDPTGTGSASPVSSSAPAASTPARSSASSAAHSAAPLASASGLASAGPALPPPAPVELLDTSAGKVLLFPVHHASFYLEVAGKTLWFDPWTEGRLDGLPKADVVFITDIHQDHYDPRGLELVSRPDTLVVLPAVVADKLSARVAPKVMANGDKHVIGPVSIEAVPMYNEKRGPDEGKLFHDKGRGNGYVLTIGGKRIYVSGDTECIPEMKALPTIDVAFVCMNLPYTMPPSEAAACVSAFKPKILVPYHYRGSDLAALDGPLKSAGVEIRKLDFYARK